MAEGLRDWEEIKGCVGLDLLCWMRERDIARAAKSVAATDFLLL